MLRWRNWRLKYVGVQDRALSYALLETYISITTRGGTMPWKCCGYGKISLQIFWLSSPPKISTVCDWTYSSFEDLYFNNHNRGCNALKLLWLLKYMSPNIVAFIFPRHLQFVIGPILYSASKYVITFDPFSAIRRYKCHQNKVKGLDKKSSYLAGFSTSFFHGSMKKFNHLAKKKKLLKIFLSSIKTKVQSSSDYPAIMGLCCFRIIKYAG